MDTTRFKIEKKHSELVDLPHEVQLKILEKAKLESRRFKWKIVWLIILIAICIVYYNIKQAVFPLTNRETMLMAFIVLGAVIGFANHLYYEKILQRKVRELAQDEKQRINDNL